MDIAFHNVQDNCVIQAHNHRDWPKQGDLRLSDISPSTFKHNLKENQSYALMIKESITTNTNSNPKLNAFTHADLWHLWCTAGHLTGKNDGAGLFAS